MSADSRRRPLVALLAEAGVASEDELRGAVAEGLDTGERLGEVVLRKGWIDEGRLAAVLARQWALPFVDENATVDERAVGLMPARAAARLAACPVAAGEDGLPLVVVAEPAAERFDAVRTALGGNARFGVVGRSTLVELLEQLEHAEAAARRGLLELRELRAELARLRDAAARVRAEAAALGETLSR